MAKALDKKNMPCNKPRRSPNPKKKKVVKACSGGKEKIIHYGATGYGHNYSKAARKSFRARHKCDQAKDKLSARYWACKDLWAGKGGSKKSSPKNRRGKYDAGGLLIVKMKDSCGCGCGPEKFKKGGTVKDACYHKVKRREIAAGNTWPSAYASGRVAKCRKVGAANYGKSSKKKK